MPTQQLDYRSVLISTGNYELIPVLEEYHSRVIGKTYKSKSEFRNDLWEEISEFFKKYPNVLVGLHAPNPNSQYSDYAAVIKNVLHCLEMDKEGKKTPERLFTESEESFSFDYKAFLRYVRKITRYQIFGYFKSLEEFQNRLINTLNVIFTNRVEKKNFKSLSKDSSLDEILLWMQKYNELFLR